MGIGSWAHNVVLGSALLLRGSLPAQELVLNGGFERYERCPKDLSKKSLDKVPHVKVVQGSPGHYHGCSATMGVPHNWAGSAMAAEGSGYVGLVLTAHGGGECATREFVQIELASPLENGRRYRLSFMVRAAQRSGYVTDRIGARFTDHDRSRKGVAGFIGGPHVENDMGRLLADTSGWMQVQGIYSALGGERFVLLGNFQACGRTSRVAMTPNKGDGVLRNMKARNALDLDPDRERGSWRRMLATQAYVYIDAVSLVPAEGQAPLAFLTAAKACTMDTATMGDEEELIPDPRFLNNLPISRSHWSNASGGTPDLMQGTAGIYLYSAVNRDHREYIRTDLRTPLDPCGLYRLRLKLRRDRSYGFAVDRIGVALVDTFTMDHHRDLLPFVPVWTSPPGHVMDGRTDGWLFCAEFQAPACARTLVLGNFDSDTATTIYRTDPQGGPFAYYFVDQVSLVRMGTVPGCELACGTGAGPSSNGLEEEGRDHVMSERTLVHFAVGGTIPEQDLDDLEQGVLHILDRWPGARFNIAGHTDDTGERDANERLSRQRAEEVRAHLLAAGVPSHLLTVTHHGSSRPLADNATEAGRHLNRRVEITVVWP